MSIFCLAKALWPRPHVAFLNCICPSSRIYFENAKVFSRFCLRPTRIRRKTVTDKRVFSKIVAVEFDLVTSSLSRSSVLRCQIFPHWSVSKNCVFGERLHQIPVDGTPIRKEKFTRSDENRYVWMGKLKCD